MKTGLYRTKLNTTGLYLMVFNEPHGKNKVKTAKTGLNSDENSFFIFP